MKKTASLLLALALLGSTTGCYCWPFQGGMGGMGMGYPLGCPPQYQQAPLVPTPNPPGAATGFNTINAFPIAMPAPPPIAILPAPIGITIQPPIVLQTLPTFR